MVNLPATVRPISASTSPWEGSLPGGPANSSGMGSRARAVGAVPREYHQAAAADFARLCLAGNGTICCGSKHLAGGHVAPHGIGVWRVGHVRPQHERAARLQAKPAPDAVLQSEAVPVELRLRRRVGPYASPVEERHDAEHDRVPERVKRDGLGTKLQVAEHLDLAVVALRRDAADSVETADRVGVVRIAEARELV